MSENAHKSASSSGKANDNQNLSGVEQVRDEAVRWKERAIKAEAELVVNESELRSLREDYSYSQERLAAVLTENQTLKFWLSRYKALKDKYLPRGSFLERTVKQIALKFIGARASAAKLRKPPKLPSQIVDRSQDTQTIEPPLEWANDPRRPPVVIAIAHWNRVNLLRKCLDAIFTNTQYDRYRVCVYDQGSADGSKEYLQSLGDRVDGILAPENVGFLKACNRMVLRYPKWDVIFLNNDTEVLDGWLDFLVETAYKAENIGIVGAKLLYPDGRLQEAGSQVFQDGTCRAYGKYESPDDPTFNQLREVDYSSGSCIYVKRAVLDRVGSFDERYTPAYYEDSDLAFAARAAGFKTVCEPRSTVVHHEYASAGPAAVELMNANRAKFVEKWKHFLGKQQKNLWAPATPDSRETVLVISELVPAPDRSSGGTRLYEFLVLLTRHYHVVLVYLGADSLREYVKPLERLGITAFYRGYAKAVHNYDIDFEAILLNNKFKYVFFELFDVAETYLGLVRRLSPSSVAVVDTFDVHFLREAREARITGDLALERQLQQSKARELATYLKADLVLTVTDDDRETLIQDRPDLNVAVLPNIHAIPEVIAPRELRHDLLFVGGFSHRPNVDAVIYFCREIFPLIRREIADVKFSIVGNAPPAEIVALGSEQILVTGYVANLLPYLDSALVSVVPLRFGSGMKGKIGEAMAYGLPVVTTSVGAEGMNLVDGVDAMIADDPKEFAERAIRLYSDGEMWKSIAENARAHAVQEWSPDAIDAKLRLILADQASERISSTSK